MLPLDSVWLPWIEGVVINTGLLGLAWLAPKKLLTPAGYWHAWGLGVLLWGCLGWPGYALMMIYFLVGSAVTKVGMARKQAAGIAEGRSGMRGPENVWGSALAGALCALAVGGLNTWGGPGQALWIMALGLGYVASLSTKLSDTTASEVGKAYGRRTFLMTTLKPVPAGTEGAVSLEGTLAGVLGSVVIAIAGWGVGLIAVWGIPICLVAALIATSAESVIGATVQGQWPWLTNEVVNIINTTLGALVAMGLGLVWVGLG
ncbi:MAG: TIGR00297 family protein [Leptolyngbya sp. LCM1.Bin17]|nr:MAG: TIGR00297 family protein [Leptolyngbya sp. LCM1.Bin17]